jgi:16S rRNA (uracil1498-N3)-methyltransferase
MPRLHVDLPLSAGLDLALPEDVARHVQVLRLQPGDTLTLFDGRGGEWPATVRAMGRRDVQVQVGESRDEVDREAAVAVTIAAVMPANDRMDWLVEKATELGAAAIVPLMSERSVLRLNGERAAKRQAHWRGIAVAAAEQCGRTRVPAIAEPRTLPAWWSTRGAAGGEAWLLSLADASPAGERAAAARASGTPVTLLSGPEGGWTEAEETMLRTGGAQAVSLGPRVLRAETAPLALLSLLTSA